MTLLEELKSLLQKDERLYTDGELLRNKIIELGLKYDKDLIKLLLSKKKIKDHFFEEIDNTLIFNTEKFMKFVENKEFLPDSYTAFKNRIGLTVNKKYIATSNEVILSWPYRDCILEGGQEKNEEKRKEIFHNEILAPDEIDRLLDPKVFTNFKRINAKGKHKLSNISLDDNFILKGNNLLVLYSLRKRYANKIKLIYIDPPYNTGGSQETFTYNNYFNHSTWLTFMKNRLTVARDLLREDGFIVIAIDHHELFYLGTLTDEIFGRNNRIGVVTVVHKPEGRNQEKFFGTSTEYMLVYAKNIDRAEFNKVILHDELKKRFDKLDGKGRYRLKNFIRLTDGKYSLRESKPHFYYPIYISKDLNDFDLDKKDNYYEVFPITDRGVERTWKTTKETFLELVKKGSVEAKKENGNIVLYEKLREEQVIKTHWIKKKYHGYHYGTKLLEEILGRKEFSYPKSLYLIIDTLKLMTSGDDLILDFFAGSGTAGHAILELNKEDGGNRKFILVEQLEEHIKVCNERIQKVMQNLRKQKTLLNSNKEIEADYVYCELMEFNEKFVQMIKKAKDSKEILDIWEEMKNQAFLSYRTDSRLFDTNIKRFKELSTDQQRKLLIDCLDFNNLYVNYSEIEDIQYEICEEDIELNKKFYDEN